MGHACALGNAQVQEGLGHRGPWARAGRGAPRGGTSETHALPFVEAKGRGAAEILGDGPGGAHKLHRILPPGPRS